ncbi:MAG: DEAD/DEAH box helicase family protein [Betaproteobacteria bacterium]
MTHYQPKVYQQQVLASVAAYFEACHATRTAAAAFAATTEALWQRASAYAPLAGCDPGMPYFCLRVPTGGGKTWLAAKCVHLVNDRLLLTEHSVVLWLVPSKPIREQTLRALKDRNHPYHAALAEAGPVVVLDLDDAKSLTRATLDTATVVIVATRQAFQVEDEECRKVYQSSGALMHHFDGLAPEQRAALLRDGEGAEATAPYSLANVLRLRRPFVIVDEAHNNRTALAFDMLARLRPAGILELTATPDMERTPSNVLHSVSAFELKHQSMIKLPVLLATEPNWQQCLADAIARRDALHALAAQEERSGAPQLRPVVLIQAEPRRAGVETLDVAHVREELIRNQNIPPEQIVVATSEERGLEKIDAEYPQGIADPACPVRYVITQRALAEGWDCPSAYVLVSMAALHSATSVEQLLGRVLRQPGAQARATVELNQSYALVVSRSFAETATALRDNLVKHAGFERREASDVVAAAQPEQGQLNWMRPRFTPVAVPLPQPPALEGLTPTLRQKITWDEPAGMLAINAPLTPPEAAQLQAAASAATPAGGAPALPAALASVTLAESEFFRTPAERGELLRVPQLALRVQGELKLLDDLEDLEYDWELSPFDAAPTTKDLAALGLGLKASEGGAIDVNDDGQVFTRFLPELQRDLGLAYPTDHWDAVRLATWLAENLPEPRLTHDNKRAFVARWLGELLKQSGFSLARANLQKFQIRELMAARVRALHARTVGAAYQQALFADGAAERAAVDAALAFDFPPDGYAPARDYDGRFGRFDFRHHYYARIGDFDSQGEYRCAEWLDMQAQKGRIRHWVRNLTRKNDPCAFFLQKADGRFYPDFVCLLPSGVVLAVEYKGDRWDAAEDDRLIGGLWAALSGGRCRFVMVPKDDLGVIEPLLA